MTIPPRRGQTTRVPVPTLPNLLTSTLPAAKRMEVVELLAIAKKYDRLDDVALQANNPALRARLQGCSTVGLDLFRVLRGERPQRSTHSRHNIGAQLRYQRRRLGRPPTEADYPAGHVVPLMACVYWGGVARWAAGASRRVQKPKGYWRTRSNQLAGLRSYIAANPHAPITQLRLTNSGFTALAKAVTLKGLNDLARELGCGRDLRRSETGYWTPDRVADTYAALCRSHDRMMSSHDLQQIGATGYKMRARVAAAFIDWHDFRRAVAARHPDMPADALPTATDGTALDSWSEVAVYQALRAAMPAEITITPHVKLGVGACSSDFVIDSRIIVEVLMLSLAEIAAPRSDRQAAYARKWLRKAAIYTDRGTPLVVVEPADVGSAAALVGKVAEVTALLDLPPPAVPIAVTAQVRPKGWWSQQNLCRVIGEVAAEVGRFPSYAQLTQRGYGHATVLLRRRGYRALVSAEIGWPTTHRRRQKGFGDPGGK